MPVMKGLLAPQNTFLDTIATRFDGTHSNFLLANAQGPRGFPIVYCSDGFCELTGYGRTEVMQKTGSCRFLYGPETSEPALQRLHKALEGRQEHRTEICFYRKDGSAFRCLLDMMPIKNGAGEVVLFLFSFKDITQSGGPGPGPSGSHGDSNHENSLGRRGASSRLRFARRQNRTVLRRLTGHFGRRGQGSMKTNRQGEGHTLNSPQNMTDSQGALSSSLATEGSGATPEPLSCTLCLFVVVFAVSTPSFPQPLPLPPPALAPLSPKCPQPPPLSP